VLGLVAIHDFLKKRARHLRPVALISKVDGFNVTQITVVSSIGPELLEHLIDMKNMAGNTVDDLTDESIMEYTQE
jgi:hypothetical protein